VRARFPLAWRIFLGTAVVVAAVLGGSLLLTARAAERAAASAAARGIASIRSQVRTQLDGNAQRLLDGARVFVQNPTFRSLVASGGRADALDQAREAAERLDATWVQLTDGAGVRLAKSDDPEAPAESVAGAALIRRALDGDALAAYGVAGDSVFFHAVAVPIEGATPGRRAGVLMATRLLDAAAARALGAAAGGDVVFYVGGDGARVDGARMDASTLPDSPALRRAIATLSRPAPEGAATPTVAIDREQYYGLVMPLHSADGRALGGVAVLHSQTAEMRPFRELERTIFLAGMAGLGLALLVSFAVARQITRPLARLVVSARRAAAGDYAADTGVRSRDEVGGWP
jgi:HAMP domain-containing protein